MPGADDHGVLVDAGSVYVYAVAGDSASDFKVNVANDVLFALEGFRGGSYPFVPGDPCGPG